MLYLNGIGAFPDESSGYLAYACLVGILAFRIV
jgi:hypothetical protein